MRALALDLGASGGKILSGSFNGTTLEVAEIHRFQNEPLESGGHLCWDIHNIHSQLLDGLRKAAASGFSSFAVDSFSNDYGLLDENGRLLAPICAYRDRRTEGVLERMDKVMPAWELYQRTGNQRARFNTLVQLVAHAAGEHGSSLETAKQLLFLPDLLNYYLCGERVAEHTIASVSQIYNQAEGRWDPEIMRAFGIREEILPPVVPSAQFLGEASRDVREATGAAGFSVCTAGHHDTASAVAAVPSAEPHFAYISSGTWALMGTVTSRLICTQRAFALNFANEGAVDGKNRLLKNIMGLWLMQECRRQMASEGHVPTFGELDAQAESAVPFRSIIDPDDASFFEPGDMIGKIQSKCHQWGQPVPETAGEISRCIQESLALAYRATLEELEELSGAQFSCVHMIGGGAHSALLNRLAAGALRRPVLAGPYEASAIGNILAQLLAAGKIRDWTEARQVVRSSFVLTEFLPEEDTGWDEAYEKYRLIRKMTGNAS